MRIAAVGNYQPEYSTENDVRKAFEYLGHEFIALQENEVTYERVREEALKSDMLLITSTWDDALPLDEMITTYYLCAKKGVPTATLHLDTFWPTSRGNRKWWLNPMFHTAYIFTADGQWPEEWKAFGKNHIWLPPAVRHDAAHFGVPQDEYKCDVAFVGSNGIGYHEDVWTYRKELVDKLRGICAKNGWSFKNPGGELDQPDNGKISRGEPMNNFYASAKLSVGDSLCIKKEKSTYWSDRAAEAPARGSLLIMPQIDALNDMYDGEMPMYKWGDWEDLESKIRYWLEVDEDTRFKKRQVLQKIAAENHTYVNRVQTILDTVGLPKA